jgi:hypothetical protein
MKRFSFILVWVLMAFGAPRMFAATVSTLADSGSGSLREAIAAGGSVDFAVTGTITLTSGELVVNGPLTINGPGAARLAVERSTAEGTPEFRVLRVQNGSVAISGLTIRNGLVGATYGNGGGILNEGSLTLNDCVVSGNRSTGEYTRGTGVFNAPDARLIANRCVLADNAGAGEYSEGGGLYVFGDVTLNDSTVSGNSGGGLYSRGGGMHVDYFGTGHVTRCTFSRNSVAVAVASAQGGGIYNYGTLQIVNSTLSGNHAGGSGGGLHVDSLSLGTAIRNCTISANTAPEGAGIFNNGFEPGHLATITVQDSIVAGNLSQDIENNGATTSAGYNLFGLVSGNAIIPSAGDQFGLTAAALKLGPLADNGGPTRTRALLTGSPAIDAGSETGFLATDQRGMPRPIGPRADIGAFEGAQPPPTNLPPTVSVEAFKADADESGDGKSRALIFRVTRTGPIDFELPVSYRVGGTAQNGVDYEELSGRMTIPIGAREAAILTYARFDQISEGDETVEIAIERLACIDIFPPPRECYEVGEHAAAFGVIHDAPVPPPAVSLELVDPEAMETLIFQNNIDWAEFRVLRTGRSTNELVVYLNTQQGSARLGEDYWLDGVSYGSSVRFLPGQSSVNVRLYPIDDDFYEGDETVFFHLIPPPPMGDPYQIDFAHSSVAMVIHDNDPATTRLDIMSPRNGQEFQPGDTITLRAQIVGPGSSNSWSIEFFAGDQRLGTTRPDAPIWWSDASGGQHFITARATNSQGTVLTSAPPATIQVGPGAMLPVVKIGVTPWHTGEPCPTCFVVPSVLTIERTPPTNTALTVFLEIDGTATAGDDYQALPASVVIPAGQRSAQLTLLARDDQLAEGPEVVRVRVLRQPPPLLPPTYFVNVYANEALVVIFDDEPEAPQARLDIVAPANGSHLRFPSTIQLSALAVNTQNEVYGPVEFYAGDQFIARSLVTATTRPAIPGLPSVHTAYWTNPPVGQYVLTARTRLSFSQSITSPPVNVTVDSPMEPVVGLETFPLQNPQAREFCPPNADCAYPGFVVRRSGPTNADLRVYMSYSGTASAGVDYPSFPASLVIPAGREAAFLTLVPNDDTLVEGPETVIAMFTAVPGHGYIQDPNRASATITIIDNDSPPLTVVGIGTDDAVARELSDSARFRISRSGDLTRDLQVYFWVRGSATSGRDYLDLYSQSPVRVPAGEQSVTLDVVPRFDELIEGMETVFIELLPSPLLGPLPGYEVDPLSRDAVAVILDTDAGPALEIVSPGNGDNLIEPPGIDLVAAAYHPTRDILGVDFYADGMKIGESRLIFDKPVPGGLIVHRFHWSNPSQGPHVLTAQGFNENGELTVVSPPIRITVSPEAPTTVVSIEATHPIAEEDSLPFDRLPLVGVFRISRTGPTNDSVPVWIQYTGSASAGEDYPVLPSVVTIPAGTASTQIRVEPIADGMPEGIESLVAAISACPPVCPECPLPPCYNFSSDSAHASATVFIRDDGVTRASLVITNPKEGANFNVGQAILIAATAIDLDGYISRVEFFDGNQRIGESEIVFIRAPDPGTPIQHSFEWRGAAAGSHVLIARATRVNGDVLMSPPVRITVGPGGNQPPQVAITRLVNGAEFPPDTAIEIVAETRDQDGYVRKVEFFADRRKIGESSVEFIRPPDPGQPQMFTFVWRHPKPGPHSLTAQATDDGGNNATSAPVNIEVARSEPLPIVAVTARDAWAVEPDAHSSANTATFRIRRFGPTNDALVVAYSLRGTAENGIDYDRLSGLTTIPAGRRSVLVNVTPLPDDLSEEKETVVLRLEEPPPSSPEVRVINPYRVGWPGAAVALISDHPPLDAEPRCVVLPDHLLHVCYAAESGHNFRLEASSDLRNWETLCDTWSRDGGWHFIDTEMDNQAHRFYRLTPEPVADADE